MRVLVRIAVNVVLTAVIMILKLTMMVLSVAFTLALLVPVLIAGSITRFGRAAQEICRCLR